MAGIKRTTPDDPYSPQGLHNSAKRSKSSLVLRNAPPTPAQERPLQQRTGSWFSPLTGLTNILKSFIFQPEPSARSTPKRTPRRKARRLSSSSFCGSRQSRQRLYPALPEVIDMTKEADEQSEDDAPGPSRHAHANVYARESTLPDMTRLNLNGTQPRRRVRDRKWDRNDVESDEEEEGHPSRARRQIQGKPSIPVMEEQLARFREMEFQAELDGNESAQRHARKTAQHFERALRDAKAERDAQREKEKVFKPISGTLIDYKARLAALTQPQDGPGSLFRPHRIQAPVLGHKQRTHVAPVKKPDDIVKILEGLDLRKKEEDEAFQKVSGPAIPTKLSNDEMEVVKKTLSNPSFKSPTAGTEQVDSRNIGRFKSGQWLADDNISYYLALITARNASDPKYPKIHAFNTFFYSKIDAGGQKAVKRWTKKVDIFAKDLILIPINVGGMHWIAAAINMNKKRIEYFDSMGSYGSAMQDVSENLLSYIRDEHQDKKGSPFDTSDWECTNAKVRTPTLPFLPAADDQKAPQQNNGSDCGIFTCQTLELVARGADPIDKGFEFSQANMPFFRQLMTYETATGKLKKRW